MNSASPLQAPKGTRDFYPEDMRIQNHMFDAWRKACLDFGFFYYELFGSLFRVSGRAVSNDAGRLIVLVIWLTTGTTLGLAAQRLTSRASIGVATQAVAFGVPPLLTFEPMHPVGLVCLLIALIVAAAAILPVRPVAGAVGLGTVVAMLLLTKINVGGLALLAVLFAAGTTLPGLCERTFIRRGAVALLVGAPIVLLFPDRGSDTVQVMAILVTGATLSLVATCTTRVTPGLPSPRGASVPRPVLWFVVAFASCAAAIVLLILALGSSLSGFTRAMFVEPTHLRTVFTVPFEAPASAINWAIGAPLVALAVRRWRQSGAGYEAHLWTAGIRIVAGLLIWLSTIGASAIVMAHGSGARLMLPLACAWVVAVPVADEERSVAERFVRALIPALAVMETLQAYPVAGTQVAAAALVFVPCGALLLHDGARELALIRRNEAPVFAAWMGEFLRSGLVAVAIAFAIATLVRPVQAQHDVWAHSVPLRAEGATKIRLPAEQAAEYSRLVQAVRQNCTQFLTYPGFNSLYLWTGFRPPTGLNTTIWMKLLDSSAQSRIVRAVRGDRGLCVVRNQSQINLWLKSQAPPRRPLVRFIEANFRPTQTFMNGEYELMERR